MALPNLKITELRHPFFLNESADWEFWRDTYEGGRDYVRRYLVRYSSRESEADFLSRQALTAVPNFAKSAIDEIRNSIFQRMQDITRTGGSVTYEQAVKGELGGVDHRGQGMNSYIGTQVLVELLIMGKFGVFVDMPDDIGPTLQDAKGKTPYLYGYTVENILNWKRAKPESPSEFQAILLRDTLMRHCQYTGLPIENVERYRYVWIDPVDGFVRVQFYDSDCNPIDRDGNPSVEPIRLELTRIPFVLFDIGQSLLTDVALHQKVLMNIESSNASYAIQTNFPIYTEQRDPRAIGSHLKPAANEDGTATTGGQDAREEAVKVGHVYGRTYPLGADRPDYISPPTGPLEISMRLCERIEETIRKLVNLAVVRIAASASGASKAADRDGLENGLAFIGLVLEAGEREIAKYWAAYEGTNKPATVKYPDRYSLKDDSDRIDEAERLTKLMFSVPGKQVKIQIAKQAVSALLASKVSSDTLRSIFKEIDDSEYITSNPEVVIAAKEAGLVGTRVASMSLGYDEDQWKEAEADRIERLKTIAATQGGLNTARGVADNQVIPKEENANEKEMSRYTDDKETTKEPTRGKGQ
jgi:hypothetical protein